MARFSSVRARNSSTSTRRRLSVTWPCHRAISSKRSKGDRKGQHSIRINKQWRVCFVWKDGEARDAEVVDYH